MAIARHAPRVAAAALVLSALAASTTTGYTAVMWAEQQDLTPPDGGSNGEGFGAAVAVSDDTAVVGSPLRGDAGAAYVFLRSGATWGTGQELVGAGATAGAQFGAAVAVSGDFAIVGAPGEGVNGGAYVFARSGGTWAQTQQIPGPDSTSGVGTSVAIDGDTAIVGALGAAFVLVRSGSTWTSQQVLTPEAGDGGPGSAFGASVAISGDTAIVGGPTAGAAGSVYVFVRSGTTWTLQQTLTEVVPIGNDGFGATVALEGDTAVVGTANAAADVFTRSGSTWTYAQTLYVKPFATTTNTSVLLGGGNVLVATYSGTSMGTQADVFAPSDAGLALAAAMQPNRGGVGKAIATSGNTFIAGDLSFGAAHVLLWGGGDGDACTSGGDCFTGQCVDGVCCLFASCPGAGQCNAAERCQPGTGMCSRTPIHEGTPCDDHDACTRADTCQDGVCAGPTTVCAPADDCHEFGACDPSNGQCSTPAKPDGTPCAGGKTCLGGLCGGPQAQSPSPSGGGCACDAAGGAPAGGALISWVALSLLRRRRRRAWPRNANRDRIDP